MKPYKTPAFLALGSLILGPLVFISILLGGGDSLPFMDYFTSEYKDGAGNIYTQVAVSELGIGTRLLVALSYLFAIFGLSEILTVFADRYINYASWKEFFRENHRVRNGDIAVGRLKSITRENQNILVNTSGGSFLCAPEEVEFETGVQVRKKRKRLVFIGKNGSTCSLKIID